MARVYQRLPDGAAKHAGTLVALGETDQLRAVACAALGLDFPRHLADVMGSVFNVSIKGVLTMPDGRVVLLENERNEWELPGGRIEPGETPAQCLAREIQEELGLQVEVGGRPINTYLFEVIPGRHVFIATYQCALVGPFDPTVSHEHKRIGLFFENRLPENLPPGYRDSITFVLRRAGYSLDRAVPGTAPHAHSRNASPHFPAMLRLIETPTQIQAQGQPPKTIEEFIGRVNSQTESVSIARMTSPSGWSEAGQTPEFDEFTVVLRGELQVETRNGVHRVSAGQSIIVGRGEWVRYSTPRIGRS